MKPVARILSGMFLSFLIPCVNASGVSTESPTQVVSDSDIEHVKQIVLHNTKDRDVSISDVRRTPVPGVYEVAANGEILYVDKTGRYAFVGARLVDMVHEQDLTQPAMDRLSQIDFKHLPFNLALKEVKGNGERQLVVFADPLCPMCREFYQQLAQIDNVTVYTFTLPIISPQSAPASIATWCTPPNRRLMTWHAYMQGAPAPQHAPASCEAAQSVVTQIAALGDRYQINNTPTLVFSNNQRIVGAMPAEELEAALTEASRRNPAADRSAP